MDFQLVLVKTVRKLRTVGPRATLALGFQTLGRLLRRGGTRDAFDLKYGTDTSEAVPLWKFRIDSPSARFGAGYQTISEQALIDAISFLRDDPKVLTFIDLGCGKGRALLVAANLGFKQIIGVEFVHELAEVAKRNLAKVRIADAVVVETDAATYRFPDSDLVVYLYNPFSEEVVHMVLANLRESLPKKLYVIYANPLCASLFDTSGFLTRLGCPTGRADIQVWSAATQGGGMPG